MDESELPGMCIADGCSLAGIHSLSTVGPNHDWVCNVHDGLQRNLWAMATSEILARRKLFEGAAKLLLASPGEAVKDETRKHLSLRGYSEIASNHDIATCRQLGGSLRQKLINECRPAMAKNAADKPRLTMPKAYDFVDPEFFA